MHQQAAGTVDPDRQDSCRSMPSGAGRSYCPAEAYPNAALAATGHRGLSRVLYGWNSLSQFFHATSHPSEYLVLPRFEAHFLEMVSCKLLKRKDGAGDGVRTRDVQLGKMDIDCK
jgi:hypothetical protein